MDSKSVLSQRVYVRPLEFTILNVSGEYYTIRVKYSFSIFWLIMFGLFYVIYYFVNRQSIVLTVKITEDKKDESNN